MQERRIVLEVTEEEYNPFKERTIGVLTEEGGLRICYEYQRSGEEYWETWQDMGASLSPSGLTKLRTELDALG